MFNIKKFRGKMAEEGCSFEKLANILGINPVTLYRKANGESEFTRREIQQISVYFSLTMQEVKDIFFSDELTETQD